LCLLWVRGLEFYFVIKLQVITLEWWVRKRPCHCLK
jgi:hypothetical protein